MSPASHMNFSLNGTSPIGQASTHRPQRMQGVSSNSTDSLAQYTTTPLLALASGTRVVGAGKPVMAPPSTILPTCSRSMLNPPHSAIRSSTRVPTRMRRLTASAMA